MREARRPAPKRRRGGPALAGYAELLEIRQDAETLSEAPQRVKEAAGELKRIVDDLLTVYAIDANVLYLAPAPTPVGTLVDEAVAEARERETIVSLEADERTEAHRSSPTRTMPSR